MNELITEIMKVIPKKSRRTKNTIFMYYYGHVNGFTVEVYKDGWIDGKDGDYKKEIYLDIGSEKENIKELKEILEYLKNLED